MKGSAMALSNTATPIYYEQFRKDVWDGRIPISREIEMEMNRIDGLIADPYYFYDNKAVEGFIAFCEAELTLTDGGDVELLPTFKLWAEQIFGWWYFDVRPEFDPKLGRMVQKKVRRRLTLKQYLIVARGAAKSMYASFIQAFFLVINTDTTQQITTAPTMKQAEEVMLPIQTAINRHRGPVFEFLTEGSIRATSNRAQRTNLASTKKGVQNFLTGSLLEIRPMSIDKIQGSRPKVATVDEWLSGDIREDVVGALEQGADKDGKEYLIVAISSEGTVRNGAGDTIKMELAQILRGEQYAPHVSIWHYKLDDAKEIDEPEMWPKAQPNLGLTVPWDTYHRDVERMLANPATANDIKAKRFGLPVEGYTFFFTYEETIPHKNMPRVWQSRCAMGADLSQGDDFCAFTFIFPTPRGGFAVVTRSYITELTLHKLKGAPRAKYQEFIDEGTLQVMGGTVLDMMQVYEDISDYIDEKQFEVEAFGYDPWGAKEFVERWEKENGEWGVEKVPQGARTESVPLGELKKLSEERMLIFNQKLMQFAMGNCIILEDNNGNRKLDKKRREDKIDNVAAMLDAYVAWKSHKDSFE
jgi:phage terminase large subunit-like protein